uniref:Pancreatic trypsin inhibitor n=1 Tax=Rhipicephalus zambeziensis TaxID=60191 RepID=A0A224YR24_9ACAR
MKFLCQGTLFLFVLVCLVTFEPTCALERSDSAGPEGERGDHYLTGGWQRDPEVPRRHRGRQPGIWRGPLQMSPERARIMMNKWN